MPPKRDSSTYKGTEGGDRSEKKNNSISSKKVKTNFTHLDGVKPQEPTAIRKKQLEDWASQAIANSFGITDKNSPSQQIQEIKSEKGLTFRDAQKNKQSEITDAELSELARTVGWTLEEARGYLEAWNKEDGSSRLISSEATKPSDKPIDPELQELLGNMYTDPPAL